MVAPAAAPAPSPAALFEQFLPLARRIAARFARRCRRRADDIESAALVALWRASERFDPARGMAAKNYVAERVQFACRDAIRRRRRDPEDVQAVPNEQWETAIDRAKEPRPEGVARVDLADLLDTLTPEARGIVADRVAGCEFEEIGRARGKSGPGVYYRYRAALRELAAAAGEN